MVVHQGYHFILLKDPDVEKNVTSEHWAHLKKQGFNLALDTTDYLNLFIPTFRLFFCVHSKICR